MHKIGGFKVFHEPRDLGPKIGDIEFGDTADPRLSLNDVLPILLETDPHR